MVKNKTWVNGFKNVYDKWINSETLTEDNDSGREANDDSLNTSSESESKQDPSSDILGTN